MANYLLTHFKGKYRLLCDVCVDTNDFPRKSDGTYEDNDVYINCENKVRIYHYGNGVLQVYVPSIQKGRNILKLYYRDFINSANTVTEVKEYDIERNGDNIHIVKEMISIIDNKLYESEIYNDLTIFNLYETDEEVLFRFKARDMNKLEKYLKPRTNGANISPFSSKNRVKNKYEIPSGDLIRYKDLIKDLPKEQLVLLGKEVRNFLKTLANKKKSYEEIKTDIIKNGFGNKEYIHSIGKWDNFLECIEVKINEIKQGR